MYKRALFIEEKVSGPDHPKTAISLNNLAGFYRSIGNYKKAEPLYKRALAIREKVLGTNHPGTALILSNLAVLYGSSKQEGKSINLFKKALEIEDRVFENIFSIASEEQKLGFVKKTSGGYKGFLSLIHTKFLNDEKALRLGLDAVLSRKGIVFDSLARQRDAIVNTFDPKVKVLWEKLTSFRTRLAKLLQGKPPNLSFEKYRSQIREFNANIGDLESQLAAMSGLMAEELEQRKVTTGKVAEYLPKDTVLIEFVKIDDFDWKIGRWASTQRYLVFILHPNEQIDLIDLGNADKLNKNIQAMLPSLTTVSYNKKTFNQQNVDAEGLYALLWKPFNRLH